MRRRMTIAVLAAVLAVSGCSMFHHKSSSSSSVATPAAPAVVQVDPWPAYAAFPDWRILGEEYCWLHETNRLAHAQALRAAGVNGTEIGLFSCAETPDSPQVQDRRYWPNRLPFVLAQATEVVQANRAMNMLTVIAVDNDCGPQFRSITPEVYRDQVLPWLRGLGPDGIVLYPVVEAENARAMPWIIYQQLSEEGWSGLKIWNGEGGCPASAPAGWLNHAHPQSAAWRPSVPSLLSNDSPINDLVMSTGSADSGVTGYREYYVKHVGTAKSIANTSALGDLLAGWYRDGHAVIYWQAHFKPGQTDWPAVRILGALRR
jgi:hypothetical protein